MFVFSTACDFDINIIIIMNLIVDAAKDKVFLKIITNKQSYTNEYSNTKENFDKMGIIIFDFLEKNNFKLEEIKNLYVNIGPGKFSSIRSSIVSCKALSMSNNINLYGFSSNQIEDNDYKKLLRIIRKRSFNEKLDKSYIFGLNNNMSDTIEDKCIAKGIKLTDQRKVIARVMSESKETYGEADHPDVDELYNRVSKIDPKISIATVYRTVKIFEEAGILTKHDFKGGKARYEEIRESHHDHLIDVKTGHIIEFSDNDIHNLQKKIAEKYGYDLVDHKLELYGVKKK